MGPVPSVGLTLTWFIWDRNLALHVTLHSRQLILHKNIVFQMLCAESKAFKKLIGIALDFSLRLKKKVAPNNLIAKQKAKCDCQMPY